MADENPLKLPPPVIGNPYIGDIGRGKLSDSPQPRRPAIPFVLWYGADEPVPPSTDTPPRPIVVTADGPITAPMVGYNIIKTMVSPPERQLVSPVIVAAQQSPNQFPSVKPYVFVEQQPSPPVLTGTPQSSLVVRAIELPWTSPQILVAKTADVSATPEPATVTASQQLSWQPPFTFIAKQPAEPPPSSVTPPDPVVVQAQQPGLPQPFVYIGEQPAEPSPSSVTPPDPVVVLAQQPQVSPFVFTGHSLADPLAAPQVPQRSTVVTADGPIAAPFIGSIGFNADSGILPSQEKPPQPVVAKALEPAPPVDQVILWTVVSDSAPLRATVVDAGPLPLGKPFTFVNRNVVPFVAPPSVPIAPTVVKAQPLPTPYVQAPWVSFTEVEPPQVPVYPTVVGAQPLPPQYGQAKTGKGFLEALAPNEVPVPIRPIVVRSEPAPQPTQTPQSYRPLAEPPPAVPVKPIVINAQPLPTQYVQTPWVSYTEVDPPKVPVYPTIIGQQPIPPQAAFVSTPKSGRWGTPPPRVITPMVNVDMSLPFRPNGWVRVAHGFAPALPLLFEGTVVGGTLEGARVSGGVSTGSAVGGTIQNGYVTGGRR